MSIDRSEGIADNDTAQGKRQTVPQDRTEQGDVAKYGGTGKNHLHAAFWFALALFVPLVGLAAIAMGYFVYKAREINMARLVGCGLILLVGGFLLLAPILHFAKELRKSKGCLSQGLTRYAFLWGGAGLFAVTMGTVDIITEGVDISSNVGASMAGALGGLILAAALISRARKLLDR